MIRITSEIVKKIFEQAKTEAPFEAESSLFLL